MTHWVIKHNVQIVPRRKMWGLTPDELVHDLEVKKRAKFDASTKFRYGDSITLTKKMRGDPQESDDTCDLHFGEVSPNIPEADIVDDQGKPLHPILSNGYFDECRSAATSRGGVKADQIDMK